MPLPEWWLVMAKRGVPFHPDAHEAFQMAVRRIRTYKGHKPVFDQPTRLLVQGIVIDALNAAPQPVTQGWVNTSLAAVGALTRWAYLNAEPLERGHLLSTHTRNRFLNLGMKAAEDTTRRNYGCRLDLIATALSSVPLPPATAGLLTKSEPVDPHSASEVATLWAWAQGLRPERRRRRVTAVLVLSLGCGLRSSELVLTRPEDVLRDADGTHVTVIGAHGTRLVTCDAVWEDRLQDLVSATSAGHLLTSPWRTTPATGPGLLNTVRDAQRKDPAVVRFSPRSLRNTWLVARLAYGTPIPTLLEAAGVESIEALKAFLPFVATPCPADRTQALRGRA